MTTATTTTTAAATAGPVEAAATKRDWHAATTLHVRRRVLLQILLLLKTKYGQVDAKISYIARRAELALYSQAFSLDEYRNPKTLNRRLHSLVVKLHMANLAAREDHAFVADGDAGGVGDAHDLRTPLARAAGKRKRVDGEWDSVPSLSPRADGKRICSTNDCVGTAKPAARESALFLGGNGDLLRYVCSYLVARDQLRLAATNVAASQLVPSFVTSISVRVATLETLPALARTSFFDRFASLEELTVVGDKRTHLHFDFQSELALVRRNVVCRSLLTALGRRALPRLRAVRWHFAFVDGVHDRITSELASVLLRASAFPQLAELSLVGNAVADDGVAFLCDALHGSAPVSPLRVLNLEQNFVGERGHVELATLAAAREQLTRRQGDTAPLVVLLQGNLLPPPPATPSTPSLPLQTLSASS